MLVGKSRLNKERKVDNLDINKEKYEFIEDIMEDDTIPIEERNIFWNEFGKKYMKSRQFRYETHGKRIAFDSNGRYRGYYNNKIEAKSFINEREIVFSYIGDDEVTGKMYNFIPHIYDGDTRGTYKVDLKINFQCGFRYQQQYTIDTGCTDTSTFMVKNWHIKYKTFAKLKGDGFPEDIFDELNTRKSKYDKITMEGIGSINKYYRLTLDPPLPVSFGNLNDAEMKYIVVPRYEDQKNEERLLGTDFMESSNYQYQFGKFNNEFGLLISNS